MKKQIIHETINETICPIVKDKAYWNNYRKEYNKEYYKIMKPTLIQYGCNKVVCQICNREISRNYVKKHSILCSTKKNARLLRDASKSEPASDDEEIIEDDIISTQNNSSTITVDKSKIITIIKSLQELLN